MMALGPRVPHAAGPAAVAHQLDRYFSALCDACHDAGNRGGRTVVTLSLAGQAVRLELAGAAVAESLLPALAHAVHDSPHPADFEVLVWDGASTATPLPPPPWSWPPPDSPVRLALPAGGDDYRIPASRTPGSFAMLSITKRRAIVCIEDAATLPWHERAAPLKQVWQWWAAAAGLRILHAGCVGTAAGAALLVGPGGSGKSSTAVLAALAGLRYVSDDYCLLEAASEPVAHSLYSTAKVHADQLARLPALPPVAVRLPKAADEKAVLFMQQAAPQQLARHLPVRCLLAPTVTGGDRPRLTRLSPAQALMALAPSTLMQLYRHEGSGCSDLASLVRRLPCWRLELGGRLDAIPALVRAHLEHI